MAPYPNRRQVAKRVVTENADFEHHYLAAVAAIPIADVGLSCLPGKPRGNAVGYLLTPSSIMAVSRNQRFLVRESM